MSDITEDYDFDSTADNVTVYTAAFQIPDNVRNDATKVSVDGEVYKTSVLTDKALKLLANIDLMKKKQNEKKNMIAVLTKAKKAYIGELKVEMLSAKSGFDFSE